MNNLSRFVFISLFTILPSFAIAQFVGPCPQGTYNNGVRCVPLSGGGASSQIGDFLATIQQLFNSIIPVLLALGVVYFVWGVIKFMIADSEEAKTKGRDTIIYGIIGFAVIIGLWGLVNLVVNTLGFSDSDLIMPSLAPIQGTVSEATCSMGGNVQGLLRYLTCLINNSIIPFLFAVAILMFIWGAVKFFFIDSEEVKTKGKDFMIWGIIGLTVMVSIWGLVGLLGNTFNIGGKVLPQVCPATDPKCK